jgi:hypothetical protein
MTTLHKTVEEEYRSAIAAAQKLESWYEKEKSSKRTWSKSFRFISIALIGLSGLFPLLKTMGGIDISDYGYVTIALAGTLLLLDKFFGFSSSWIRYALTIMELRRNMKQFILKWHTELLRLEKSNDVALQESVILLGYINEFVTTLHEMEKQETMAWATEFQSNLSELQKLANSKIEMLRPGSIKVEIKNGAAFTNVEAILDNVIKKPVLGTFVLFNDINIGPHEIVVHGLTKDAGTQTVANLIVEVEANKMTTAEIAL